MNVHYIDTKSPLTKLTPVQVHNIFQMYGGSGCVGLIIRPDDPESGWSQEWVRVARRIVVRDEGNDTVACLKDPDGKTWDIRKPAKELVQTSVIGRRDFDVGHGFDVMMQVDAENHLTGQVLWTAGRVSWKAPDNTPRSFPINGAMGTVGNTNAYLVYHVGNPNLILYQDIGVTLNFWHDTNKILLATVNKFTGVIKLYRQMKGEAPMVPRIEPDGTIDNLKITTCSIKGVIPDNVPGIAELRATRDRYIDMFRSLTAERMADDGARKIDIRVELDGVDYTDLVHGNPTHGMLRAISDAIEQEYNGVCRQIYELASDETLSQFSTFKPPAIDNVVRRRAKQSEKDAISDA